MSYDIPKTPYTEFSVIAKAIMASNKNLAVVSNII